MTASHAVISGASIAGLSAAFWLRRTGWRVTVIERAPAFRDGGQNVDVRGVAREVLHRMGLADAVKAMNTTETGTVLVGSDGGVVAELPSDGPDGATAELEVLRGDLARVLLDHLPDDVEVVYGETIVAADDAVPGAEDIMTVTTDAGRELSADLLVVAEGVRSTTRDLVFGDSVGRRDLGITMAFGTIERTNDDDDRWRWYTATKGRQVHLRPDNHGTTRAILAFAHGQDLTGLDHDDALDRLRDRFADAGWQAPRVIDGFAASEDVYVDRLTQIRMDHWHRGRVVLAGDAGWCVTPIGGGGASLALVSGYVLAAQLAETIPASAGASATTSDEARLDRVTIERALTAYETWMRPLVDDVQRLPPGIDRLAYPQTRAGVAVRGAAMKVLTSPPLKAFMSRFTRVADDTRTLPTLASATAG